MRLYCFLSPHTSNTKLIVIMNKFRLVNDNFSKKSISPAIDSRYIPGNIGLSTPLESNGEELGRQQKLVTRETNMVNLARSEKQLHVNRLRLTEIVKPVKGTLLYRQKTGNKTEQKMGEINRWVVIRTQKKMRGKNKGITGIVFCRKILDIHGTNVYYDTTNPLFVITLNNHGKWFNKSILKDNVFYWDEISLALESKINRLEPIGSGIVHSPSINIDYRHHGINSVQQTRSWEPSPVKPYFITDEIEGGRTRSLSQENNNTGYPRLKYDTSAGHSPPTPISVHQSSPYPSTSYPSTSYPSSTLIYKSRMVDSAEPVITQPFNLEGSRIRQVLEFS